MNARRAVHLAILSLLASACAKPPAAPPPPDAAAIRAALTAQLNKIGPAATTGDTATLAGLFTDDATWVLPDASTYKGHAAIATGAWNFFHSLPPVTFGEMNIDQLIVVSETEAVSFAVGHYTMAERGKAPAARLNPFADHWRKGSDGVWRIAYEINADGAAPAAAAPARN